MKRQALIKYLLLSVIYFAMSFSYAANSQGATDPYIDDDFVLFWANPTREYQNIPLDFRFVVYEKDNQKLTWKLTNAPSGMAIDGDGKINWTPSNAQVGVYSITVRVTRQAGDYIERIFTLTVGTSDYIFVSTTGSDSNDGTLDHPFATIEHAMRSIQNGNGKTILIRGGTYYEYYSWEKDGVISPFRSKYFSEGDPVEIRSYPGEWAVLDAELKGGNGLWVYATSYIAINNIEVKNVKRVEGAGIAVTAANHVVIRDTIVHDSHWLSKDNCTGYKIQGVDVVLDHTVGYDNIDPNNNFHWNSSNYLVYTAAPSSGSLYILNSLSYNSVAGFKIKHAGPAKLVLHNNVSHNDVRSFLIGSDFSSIRYNVSYDAISGVVAGAADPNAYMLENILIENNTVINAAGEGISFQSGYFINSASTIRDNIIYNNIAPAGTGESDRRLMGFWYYDDNASAYSVLSDRNLFFSQSNQNIVRYGHSNFNYSFASWQDRGHDSNSIFADPLFNNIANNDFRPKAGSPACGAASDGGDVGALACISSGGADTTPPTTTTSPTGSTFASAQNVTLSANEAATIYYTTNGTTPTTSSTQYYSPINISATTTLKYFSKDMAGNSETPKTQTYTINIPVTYSISNLLTLVTNWLKTGTVSDVNADNIVNTRDLGIMMSKWR